MYVYRTWHGKHRRWYVVQCSSVFQPPCINHVTNSSNFTSRDLELFFRCRRMILRSYLAWKTFVCLLCFSNFSLKAETKRSNGLRTTRNLGNVSMMCARCCIVNVFSSTMPMERMKLRLCTGMFSMEANEEVRLLRWARIVRQLEHAAFGMAQYTTPWCVSTTMLYGRESAVLTFLSWHISVTRFTLSLWVSAQVKFLSDVL